MEHTFNGGKWSWHELSQSQVDQAIKFAEQYNSYNKWAEETKKNMTNNLQVDTSEEGKEALWGSLVYYQNVEEKEGKQVFHFYLTKKCLITDNLDVSMLDGVDEDIIRKKMDQADCPVEGFMIMVGDLMNHFLGKIDAFEVRLRDLLWRIKEKNNTEILDQTAKNRHELLIWQNLIIPVLEIKYGIEETFGNDVSKGIHFKRAAKRIERAYMLINEYDKELKAMVELENTVSTHRGNEIMKTLTVLTTLFTPVTAWGAVWGMNFKNMPELDWKLGYIFSWGIIAVSTLILYIYLLKKGWMGDILRGKRKNSFFK
ncbi:Mg2+ transporter protein, CorA-like protein [Bacillus aerolatus]|uniref:Mg2+ transporter protein, CorA-like protein n=1 Tax=Bacillus aerolatus TaxID=2653354 RepID=A0A6I1FIG1_9BACI|nr:magnesium transporter CorA family protein [Bacillus aerolatus]KAB7708217.1 Mg2+ transporter protein, CorA-like protein [Bacillus aerolatus]